MDNFLNKRKKHLQFKNASAAIIINSKNEYLMQLRDNKESIFYPNHWGLFGGASEANEDPIKTVYREVLEEISVKIIKFDYFTRQTFDLDFIGHGQIKRTYFVAQISIEEEKLIKLNEGKEYKFFNIKRLINLTNLVPYDAYAIWLHVNYST
tara:strand:+ start:3153 stop:3608 length:456 start_codon:yes stop_codon:yes gene_type:complete